ncbi:MAG: HAMP domain-containing protein [Candidatus Koribacter versatilis]|uniref:HAMP domain-containing protein n=1 Tax=Candidatus Korobacter versatilis TaxID=658062 RepID=A0A932A802_9BACT|nr:HAMP domain-containing protein [Candidatus Koribacter versatilis]
MAEGNLFPAFYRRCIRNLVAGTALSIVPAGAFYLFVFPYTPEQLAVLGVLGFVDLLLFLPLDILILRWTLRPVAAAWAELSGPKGPIHQEPPDAGQKPRSSTEVLRRGMERLLDAPWIVVLRVYGAHAPAASAGITLLVMAANRWLNLGIPANTFPLYWILNMTVIPVAHVVYEFAAMERAIQGPASALAAEVALSKVRAVPFTMGRRMGVFFPLLALAPVLLVSTAAYFKSQALGAQAQELLRALALIGTCCFGLLLFLMWTLGGQLKQQTATLMETLDRVGRGEFQSRAELYSTDEFGQIAGHVNTMASGLAERERLRDLFGAYMTTEVATALLARGGGASLAERTEKRYVAILFLDVRGFTAFSNERTPEVVVGVLNRLLEAAVEAIAEKRGTVNKYLGDGLLAIFGAPIALENPCAAAVEASLEIARRVRALNHLFAATGVPPMKIGIGIHAGDVVVGSIGSAKHKLEYTVIGDAVNVASRIEQLNKPLGTELLVSEEVWSKCGALQPSFGPAMTEQVKGVEKPVTVYPILAAQGAAMN